MAPQLALRMPVLARFVAAREGAVAPIFALGAFALVASIGVTLDYTSITKARAELQASTDNAALSLVMDRSRGLKEAELNGAAHQRVAGALPPKLAARLKSVGAQAVGPLVEVKTEAVIPLGFSGLMGKTELTVEMRSTADYAPSGRSRKVEIALVAGIVGGLNDAGRKSALTAQVQAYIDRARLEAKESDSIRIALVPYAEQIKLSTNYRSAPWLTFGGTEERPQLTAKQEQRAASDGMAAARLMLKRSQLRIERTDWNGCVTDRNDPSVIAFDAAIRHPAARCPSAEWHGSGDNIVEPLTSRFDVLRKRVGGWRAEGCENTALGLAWGAATLLPQGPFGAAAALNDAMTRKILILISGAPAAVNRHYGLCIGPDQHEPKLDATTRMACEAIRKMGVTIFVVNFVGGNRDVLRACAGDGMRYREVASPAQFPAAMAVLAEETLTGGPKVARLVE